MKKISVEEKAEEGKHLQSLDLRDCLSAGNQHGPQCFVMKRSFTDLLERILSYQI